MNLTDTKTLATTLMAAHNLSDDWVFKWSRAKTFFGWCDHTSKTIELSRYLTELNDEAEARNTILHEIAHALAGPHAKHGPMWREIARSIGCDGKRCYGAHVVKPPAPYLAVCPNECGTVIPRYRKSKMAAACTRCCRMFNGGVYSEQFRFQLVPNTSNERMTANG